MDNLTRDAVCRHTTAPVSLYMAYQCQQRRAIITHCNTRFFRQKTEGQRQIDIADRKYTRQQKYSTAH